MNDNIITGSHLGITYSITNEAIEDLRQQHGIDAIAEIKRAIELHDKNIILNVEIGGGVARLRALRGPTNIYP